MKKIFSLFASSRKNLLFQFLVLTVLIALLDIGGVYILGSSISAIFSSDFDSSNGVIALGSVSLSYKLIAVIFFLRMVSIAFCNFLLGKSIFKIAEGYSSRIFEKSVVNSRYRQHTSTEDKSAVIAVDTNVILNTFLIPLCRLVTEILVIAGVFVVLASTNLQMTLVATVITISTVIGIQKSLGYISARLGLLRQMAEKNRIEAIQRAADFQLLIDVYSLKRWLNSVFHLANARVTDTGAKQFFIMSLPKYFYETFFILCLLAFLTLSSVDLSSSYLVVILIARLMPALNGLSTCWASFSTSIAASTKISDILEAPPNYTRPPSSYDKEIIEDKTYCNQGSNDFKAQIKWSKNGSTLSDFPPSNPFAWDISLTLTKGDVVSISGPSGVGKSTLLRSIIGQSSKPNSVKFNDINYSSMDKEWLKEFAYVPQESFIFVGTVRDNILLGRDLDEALMQRSISDSKLFDLSDTSRDLSLDSYLSPVGSSLSGGQLQRLALARALYSDVSILLLDEFTSALDEETENLIIATIKELSSNLAVVGVSHRPAFSSISNKSIGFKKGMPEWK